MSVYNHIRWIFYPFFYIQPTVKSLIPKLLPLWQWKLPRWKMKVSNFRLILILFYQIQCVWKRARTMTSTSLFKYLLTTVYLDCWICCCFAAVCLRRGMDWRVLSVCRWCLPDKTKQVFEWSHMYYNRSANISPTVQVHMLPQLHR